MSDRKYIFLLLLILIIGFLLRVTMINWGLPSENLALSTYNPDEQNSYHTLEKWNPKQLKFPAGQVLHWGNLHLFVLAASLGIGKITGYVHTGNRDFYINNLKQADRLYITGRLISVIFGTASIIIVYLIGNLLLKNKISGILLSVILAFLPVHIINSIYVRPDIMMMFFCLLVIYFSLKIIEDDKKIYYILNGIFLGFAIATKYSAGSYILLPVLVHFIRYNSKIKYLLILYTVSLLSFIVGCPYIFDIVSFKAAIKHLISLSSGIWYSEFGHIPGWWRYFTWYLPSGIGILLLLTSICGFILMIFNYREKNNLLILIAGVIVFIFTAHSRFQAVWHTLPVIPFIVIYAGYFLYFLYTQKNYILKISGRILVVFILCYTSIYSFANVNLFIQENTRKQASDWIIKNISEKSKIAIAKSFFWTPPVLRQYNPPYKVLMGVDPVKYGVDEGVIGLKDIIKQTDYIVLTEYEYRSYIHPELKKFFPEQSKIIEEIFYGRKFKKIIEFDKQAEFLGIKFKKKYPPLDWLIPNPKIIIFKKNQEICLKN